MAEKALTIKGLLETENFDPFNIDMTEFQELSDAMPREADLNLATAEKLASLYLRGADRVSEVLSNLILLEQKAKINKNKTRAQLYLCAKDEGHDTINERNAYADSHDTFIQASELYIKIQVVRNFFEMKHENYLNAHRLMKDRLKSELRHQGNSGWNEMAGSVEDKKVGEREW